MSDEQKTLETAPEQGSTTTTPASAVPEPVAPTAEPELETTEPEVVKPIVFSKEVKLVTTGEVITVKKLKAGKYYEAQKSFVDWLQTLEAFMRKQKLDPAAMLGKDGGVDVAKIEAHLKDVEQSTVSAMLSMAEGAAEKRIILLAKCLEMDTAQLQDKFYPEDLNAILEACMEVNNFMANLKKSVAPTSGLGA